MVDRPKTDKAVRLITLMNELLGAVRPITAEELRRRVPGYPESTESFKRTFERDKEELRVMGAPLLVEDVPASDPPVKGYRIRHEDWELKDPGLEPDELEALNLAAALVGSPGGMGQRALFKLGSGAAAAGDAAEIPADPDLVAAFTGVSERRSLRFSYRGTDRVLDPYRLEFARGKWYVLGRDHGHDAPRWFRMSRIEGSVSVDEVRGAFDLPDGPLDALELTPWAMGKEGPPVAAQVWFDPEIAQNVRAELGPHREVRHDDTGLVVELDVTNHEGFRSWVLSFLDRAEVLSPPELRADIVAWLTELADG